MVLPSWLPSLWEWAGRFRPVACTTLCRHPQRTSDDSNAGSAAAGLQVKRASLSSASEQWLLVPSPPCAAASSCSRSGDRGWAGRTRLGVAPCCECLLPASRTRLRAAQRVPASCLRARCTAHGACIAWVARALPPLPLRHRSRRSRLARSRGPRTHACMHACPGSTREGLARCCPRQRF